MEDANRFRAGLLLAQQMLATDHKVLHLEGCEKIREYLSEFGIEALKDTAEQHPILAALGYAVSERQNNRPHQYRRRPTKAKVDEDVWV